MTASRLPAPLQRFILTSIPSVPFVEAMLLFRAAGRAPLATAEIARRLYIAPEAAAELVEQLRAAGVIGAEPGDPRCRYNPADPTLAAHLEALAHHYAHDLIAVTQLIHSKTGRKAQQFADAFRWKKDS